LQSLDQKRGIFNKAGIIQLCANWILFVIAQ